MALSDRHQQFINEYIGCYFNGSAAYRRAYPKSSAATARANAARLLANASIAEEIQRRITANAMSADEVLARLSAHARGDLGEFLSLSLDQIKQHPHSHLLKKLMLTETITENKKGDTTTYRLVSLELYSAQAALKLMLTHVGPVGNKERGGEHDADGILWDEAADWWKAAELVKQVES